MTYLAIVNPAAGAGKCGTQAGAVLERLRAAGLRIEEVRTERAGHATEIARAAFARGVRKLIAVGGDGTSYEILNGVLPEALEASGERPVLGFLPLGTGNSFLRDFTSRGVEGAIEALLRGGRRPCDVVRLEHDDGARYFMNLMSAGFVADVATTTNRRFKGLGPAGYVVSVVLETASLEAKQWRLRPDGGRAWDPFAVFISFNNSRYTGGNMMMAPYADTADGKLDIVVAGPMSRGRLITAFPRIFRGTHVHMPELSCTQVRDVELDVPGAVDLMIDGEVERYRPKRLTALPHAIDVCV
jgi:YegS/Rv2252/BmrU family lipid kinase